MKTLLIALLLTFNTLSAFAEQRPELDKTLGKLMPELLKIEQETAMIQARLQELGYKTFADLKQMSGENRMEASSLLGRMEDFALRPAVKLSAAEFKALLDEVKPPKYVGSSFEGDTLVLRFKGANGHDYEKRLQKNTLIRASIDKREQNKLQVSAYNNGGLQVELAASVETPKSAIEVLDAKRTDYSVRQALHLTGKNEARIVDITGGDRHALYTREAGTKHFDALFAKYKRELIRAVDRSQNIPTNDAATEAGNGNAL